MEGAHDHVSALPQELGSWPSALPSLRDSVSGPTGEEPSAVERNGADAPRGTHSHGRAHAAVSGLRTRDYRGGSMVLLVSLAREAGGPLSDAGSRVERVQKRSVRIRGRSKSPCEHLPDGWMDCAPSPYART